MRFDSHFRCILDISFGAVKLQSKSDALPTKCVLSHSHFRGILELSAVKFNSAEKLSSID